MPIFTYQCKNCRQKFDLLVGMSAEKSKLKCPKCANANVEKQFAPFNVMGSSDKGSSGKCSSCLGGSCSSCH